MLKKLSLFLILSFLFTQKCTSQTRISKETIQEKAFTFEAERIVPSGNKTLSTVNAKFRNSSDILNINGDGYGFVLENGVIKIDLPYIGESHTYTIGAEVGIKEELKDLLIKEIYTRKTSTFVIKPHDSKDIREITIEIYKNGKAYVSFNFNNKRPISYDGFVRKNTKKKE